HQAGSDPRHHRRPAQGGGGARRVSARWLGALGLLLGAVPLCAQSPPDSARSPVIRGGVVEPRDIFDPEETKASSLVRFMNSVHATTRRGVVERELLFKVGERFDSAKVDETARNLRALGVFRRVIIDSVHTDSGTVLRVV